MGSPFYRLYRQQRYRSAIRMWKRIPRHPDFKYELLEGDLWITGRPRAIDALLDLSVPPAQMPSRASRENDQLQIRKLTDADWPNLTDVFIGGYADQQPFASWSGPALQRAARSCLSHAKDGGEGPLIHEACHVALGISPGQQDSAICGALLATLVDARHIPSIPTEATVTVDGVVRVPHLTYLFVDRWRRRRGVGTQLLLSAIRALREARYTHLASTVLHGSAPSLIWHWRNGFSVLSGSYF
jgi:ribosomal protein S18 acetylase RimI-like enzyme